MSSDKRNNPFVLVDTAIVAAALASIRGNKDKATEMRNGALQALDAAKAELGDMNGETGMDLSKLKSLGVDGDGEKIEKIVEHCSHLSAATQALNEMKSLAGLPEWQERADNGVADARATAIVEAQQPQPSFGDMVMASHGGTLEGLGTSLFSKKQVLVVGGGDMDAYSAVFQTSDGIGRDTRRGPQVGLASNAHRPRIVDAFNPAISADSGAVKFLRETLSAEGVVRKGEGVKAGEIDVSYADVTITTEKLIATLPVTQEQLDDVPQARALLDRRIRAICRGKFDKDLTNGGVNTGAGSAGGLVTQAGQTRVSAATAAGGPADPIKDIRHGMRLCETTGDYMATAIMLNDSVWADQQTKQTNGIYALGSPVLSPQSQLWGIGVYPTSILADGNADNEVYGVVADTDAGCDIYVRRDVTVDVGYSADDFERYQLRLRVVLRAALAVYATHAVVRLRADV